MTISQSDAELLASAGFTNREIMELANAKTLKGADQPPININSPAWQRVLESRRQWWTDKLERGWEEGDIIREIENYYKRDEKRTPFDFLRAEYRPPKRIDYMEAIRRRHQAQIHGELDGYYRRRR